LTEVFIALAVALAAFGLINAAAVAAGAWFKDNNGRGLAVVLSQEQAKK
jgi:hypothetical protein